MDALEERAIACVAVLLDRDVMEVGLSTPLTPGDADSLDWAEPVLALESEFGAGR